MTRQRYGIEFEEGVDGHRHVRHNHGATAEPTASDGRDSHYGVGSLWVYGTTAWMCISIEPMTGDADWQPFVSFLTELADIDLTGLAHGDVLQWDTTSGAWEPLDFTMANLDDVDFDTPPSVGDIVELDDTPVEGSLFDNTGISASGTADNPANSLVNDSSDSRMAYNEYVRYDFGEAVSIWSVAMAATYPYNAQTLYLEYSLDGSTAWTSAGTPTGSGQSWSITCTVPTVESRYWRIRNAGATERLRYITFTESLAGEYWRPTAHDHSAEIATDIATHTADDDAHHAKYTDAEALVQGEAAVTTHEGEADPHPGYLTSAEGDAAYEAAGAVATHAAIAAAHHAKYLDAEAVAAMGVLGDANPLNHDRYTDAEAVTATAASYEAAGSIATHAAIAAAHHSRYTDAEAVTAMGVLGDTNPLNHDRYTDAEAVTATAASYEAAGSIATHAADVDAHHAKYTDAEAIAATAASYEAAGAIATHAALAAAHHAKYTDAEAVSAVEAAGALTLTGSIAFDADSAYDLAENAVRIATGYFDTVNTQYVRRTGSLYVQTDDTSHLRLDSTGGQVYIGENATYIRPYAHLLPGAAGTLDFGTAAYPFRYGYAAYFGSRHVADTGRGYLKFERARAGPAAVQNLDDIVYITGYGHDGTDYGTEAMRLLGEVTGTVAANDVQGRWVFYTRDTGGTLSQRWQMDSDGNWLPYHDSSYDIATSAVRVATGWFDKVAATDVETPDLQNLTGNLWVRSSGTIYLYADGAFQMQLTEDSLQPYSGITSLDLGSSARPFDILYANRWSFDSLRSMRMGSGSPEGSIAASVGSMYLRSDGGTGTTLYIKESGAGNTGWVAK